MIPLTEIKHRDDFGAWLSSNGYCGKGVEVGVHAGLYSKMILDHWHSGTMLYGVDPYCVQPRTEYEDSSNSPDIYRARSECERRFAHDERYNLLVMKSLEAVTLFNDGELDFVYLDGNHSFEAVSADLRAWWPKVRAGGVLCGHDYYNNVGLIDGAVWNSEAERAVLAWHGSRPHVSQCTSWWILKP